MTLSHLMTVSNAVSLFTVGEIAIRIVIFKVFSALFELIKLNFKAI
jgi:hypothetical protein